MTRFNVSRSRVLLVLGAFALSASFSPARAASPDCEPVDFGTKCVRCAGWAAHESWSQMACNYKVNPVNPGFPCPSFKSSQCGSQAATSGSVRLRVQSVPLAVEPK